MATNTRAELLTKLTPIPADDILKFMGGLRGGTYFNMGMYSPIPIARGYKDTFEIYKVVEMTAIVSGVDYENIGTTKDFRAETGKDKGSSWYDHMQGYENKVGQHKTKPDQKYVLWDIKRCSGTNVRYYLVDTSTGDVTPVTKEAVLASDYLTASEKKKLTPTPVTGISLTTGELVTNQTVWRTTAFDHIFWLNQSGNSTAEYGVRFEEDLHEDVGGDLFADGHPWACNDLDSLLAVPSSREFDLEF